MRVKAKSAAVVLVLTLFFLFIPAEIKAQEVGIAISGPLVSGSTFDVASGQRIESYIRVENTGMVPQNITFSSEMTSGVLSGIVTNTPSVMQILPESAAVGDISFEVQPNASVFSEILIQVTAAGISKEDNKSVVHAAASARVRFRLSNKSVLLHVRTLDQWSWPIPNLDISISREHLVYVRQPTNESGQTSFTLAVGLYRIRVYDNLSLLDEAVFNLTQSRFIEFHVFRGLRPTETATLHLVEILFGIGIGYVIHWARARKRRKGRTESDVLFEWATGGLS